MQSLIWFQHMHKAAGTTIAKLAWDNRVNFYQPNYNGNPRTESGDAEILYYRFSEKLLQSFIDSCIDSKVQFIGCEWGFPKEPLMDPRIFYLTCFRKPWDRFVSNYSYDHFEHPELYPDMDSWLATGREKGYSFARNNYYTFILAGLDEDHTGPVSETHYSIALANLRKFDLVLILESPECFKMLGLVLGWQVDSCDRFNPTSKKLSLDFYEDSFLANNKYDTLLYEEACKLAATKISEYKHQLSNWMSIRDRIEKAKKSRILDQKTEAVESYLQLLAGCNSAKLRHVSPKLLEIVEPCNETEIVNLTEGLDYILNIIHHLSFVCYYTPFKSLGGTFCKVLLDTKVTHGYHEHARDTLRWYV